VDYIQQLGSWFLLNIISSSSEGVDASSIKKYDFSGANCELITSVPGYHNGKYLYQYGHMSTIFIILGISL
jgi:hypothetical protein